MDSVFGTSCLCMLQSLYFWFFFPMQGISHTMKLLERFHTILDFYKWLPCKFASFFFFFLVTKAIAEFIKGVSDGYKLFSGLFKAIN